MSTQDAPRVFGFGSACVDFRIRTPDLGEGYVDKLLAREVRPMGGGATANCLTQVARLGGSAHWLGKLGTDPVGDIIVRQLEEDSVGTGHLIRQPGAVSPFNVAVYAGEHYRRVGGFLLPNSLAEMTPEDVERLAGAVSPGDWVIAEIGEIPLADVDRFCSLVKERGARVAIDIDLDPVVQCGASPELVRRVLSHADVLIPNRAASGTLYPDADAREMARAISADYGTAVVVTAGDEGAWFTDGAGEPMLQPAIPTTVVDTVGAGDAFHGGLLFGLASGWPLARAVKLAAVCGAANCSARGARTGMPGGEILTTTNEE